MATIVTWRNLVLTAATGHRIESVEGWESLPSARYDKQPRARAHGTHRSPVYADERVVTVTGECHSLAERDALLLQLQAGMTFTDEDGDEEPLTISLGGRTLTAWAQLLRCDPVVAVGSWNVGQIRWVAQWRCPDPLRYGPERPPATTGLPTTGGGLTYPLTYPLTYGTAGATGQITLSNAGTADAPIVFEVNGGTTTGLEGFEISAAGRRITYPMTTPPGQPVVIDTGAGTVLVEGTADRRGELTYADWLLVPRADPYTGQPGTLAVQFTSMGGYDADALLSAWVRDTYW